MQKELTAKQQRFIDFYDGNATAAAIKAGYSEKSAKRIAAHLMDDERIIAAIQAREKSRSAPDIADREARQKFWSAIMRDENTMIMARLKASELLAKSEGDFLERAEITGRGSLTVQAVIAELSSRGHERP